MARGPGRASRNDLPDNGKISFVSVGKGRTWEVHYTPKPSAIEVSRRAEPDYEPPRGKILLAKADTDGDWLETYPLNATRFGHGLFGPKYEVLRTIRFEKLNLMRAEDWESAQWTLKRLTDGFVVSPEAGLGIDFELMSIVNELEEAGVSTLVIRGGPRAGLPVLSAGTLTIARVQFDEVRRAVRGIHRRALDRAMDEKHRIARNTLLSPADSARFPEQPPVHEKGAILAAIRAGVETVLSKKDREAALGAVAPLARAVAVRKPAVVQALAREVEVITLEQLIIRFETLLAADKGEASWQTFFQTYPFALKLAFGYPIVALGDQVSVGGGRFDGKGEKITDFTASAALSGNLAIVEIKTPGTRLLGASEYREGVYAPSRDLSGSVTQVLDQRYRLQTEFATRRMNSRAWELEVYAVQCLVIIGRNPTPDDEKKSFEMFRRDLRYVTVLTFDEMLLKLKTILDFLRADLPAGGADEPKTAPSVEEDGGSGPDRADEAPRD